MLALGRAMGENMAVTMIIGNSTNLQAGHCLAPGTRSQPCWPTNLAKSAAFRVSAFSMQP